MCHFSAVIRFRSAHQNMDTGTVLEVLLRRKIYNPFKTHPILQILYTTEPNQLTCLPYPDSETAALGKSRVKNFTPLRPTQAGSHQLTPTTNMQHEVKANFSAFHC